MTYRSTQECACRSTAGPLVKLAHKAAVQLTTCAYYEDDGPNAASSLSMPNDRVSQSRMYSICCPNKFFSTEFLQQIMTKRSDPQQQWIFDLIRGQVTETEVVCLNSDEWMLVKGIPLSAEANRYLVVFKDLEFHTIRDLRQKHLPILRQMKRHVRRWSRGTSRSTGSTVCTSTTSRACSSCTCTCAAPRRWTPRGGSTCPS
jgi:hypothetical protein